MTIVPEDRRGMRRVGRRLARQLRWARDVGIGRLIEEDRLSPRDRLHVAARRTSWRLQHRTDRGSAAPVFVVGMQRSGTNMLMRGLQELPEVLVYNENSRRAFDNYRLRDDQRIARLVAGARARCVVFKPLCDSHDVGRLLDTLPVRTAGRALWVYRDVDGRARSALTKFGDVNLRVLRDIAAGSGADRWQAQRLSPSSLELIGGFDYTSMTPQTAAALFWYVRNSLFFELDLDDRPDVMLCSYDRMVSDPHAQAAAICQFLGLERRLDLLQHSETRSPVRRDPLPIDPTVRKRCDELAARLDAVSADMSA